tara:strand:- start:2506 stop:2931 length:426 start_codon:yes stop_codon:yes gene_type:complete
MNTNLFAVDPKDIPHVWDEVKPLINKALSHANGEMDVSDVLTFLFEGSQILWIGIKNDTIFCAGTTEVVNYPQKKILRIITFASKTGHDYELWKDFADTLENFGTKIGCSSLEAWTRKGLAKKLKWDNEYSVITRHFNKGD